MAIFQIRITMKLIARDDNRLDFNNYFISEKLKLDNISIRIMIAIKLRFLLNIQKYAEVNHGFVN